MESFNLTKKDCKLLLIAAVVLPIVCFIGGLYTATVTNADNVSPGQMENSALRSSETAEKQLETDSIAAIEQQSDKDESVFIHKHFIVQAGLFSELDNAKRFQKSLNKRDIEARLIEGEGFYRVIVGSFYSIDDAKSFSQVVAKSHNLKVFITSVGEPSPSQFIASL